MDYGVQERADPLVVIAPGSPAAPVSVTSYCYFYLAQEWGRNTVKVFSFGLLGLVYVFLVLSFYFN